MISPAAFYYTPQEGKFQQKNNILTCPFYHTAYGLLKRQARPVPVTYLSFLTYPQGSAAALRI